MLPIVDISRHQGAVNFATMRAAGVAGVILRVSNGDAEDGVYEKRAPDAHRFATYWAKALAAGYTRDDLAVYTFINPKRGTAHETADATLAMIDRVVGDTRIGYMLDIEAYHQESPLPGTATLAGPAFADYIRAHRDRVLDQADRGAFVFGYTNRAFWNGPSHRPSVPWVGDAALAAELEWLVARYPAYSLAAYERNPLPPTPAGWAAWASRLAPAGPTPPIGGTWLGWQFSAGFNRQAKRYGCSSSDLDLNIVDPDAWARWTARTIPTPAPLPPPSPEVPDMTILIRNAEPHTFTDGKVYPARSVVWSLEAGELRHVSAAEFGAILAAHGLDQATGMPSGIRHAELTNAQLDALPRYTKPTAAAGPVKLTGTFVGTAAP